jgi:shikimate dehydrogenase
VETALAGAASITVVNRGVERGQELTRLLAEQTPATAAYVPWDGPHRLAESTDIVVNATSVGLFPDIDARLDLDIESLREAMVVADVIPNPPTTRLLEDAAARGCRTLDGLGMLVNQGVLGIKLWTGVDADATVMYDALAGVLDS